MKKIIQNLLYIMLIFVSCKKPNKSSEIEQTEPILSTNNNAENYREPIIPKHVEPGGFSNKGLKKLDYIFASLKIIQKEFAKWQDDIVIEKIKKPRIGKISNYGYIAKAYNHLYRLKKTELKLPLPTIKKLKYVQNNYSIKMNLLHIFAAMHSIYMYVKISEEYVGKQFLNKKISYQDKKTIEEKETITIQKLFIKIFQTLQLFINPPPHNPYNPKPIKSKPKEKKVNYLISNDPETNTKDPNFGGEDDEEEDEQMYRQMDTTEGETYHNQREGEENEDEDDEDIEEMYQSEGSTETTPRIE